MSNLTNRDFLKNEKNYLSKAARVKYFDLVIDHAKGAKLYDIEGKAYIDLLSSASAANVGHSHPKVVAAIQKQAEQLVHYTAAYYANVQTSKLVERLAKIAPGEFEKKVALGNSGSDANEGLIKFARAYTGRPYIVSFTGSYHGSSYGSISLSGVSLNMSKKIGPLLPNIVKLPFPDGHKQLGGESDEAFNGRMWDDFLDPFNNWLPADEVAAILIEPIQGDGGIVATPPAFMKRLYEFAQSHGILFAVDEVNQGLGRTGEMWSISHYGIAPDLLSVGKSLASGLPLSALIGRSEIMDALDAPAHVYTTAGNPICAAAAHATLDILEEEKLVQRSKELGQTSKEFFEEMKSRYRFIGDVRMYGLNGGIDIVKFDGEKDVVTTTQIIYRLFQLGVLVISLRGNILRFQPPLTISEEELMQAFERLEKVFDECQQGKLQDPPVTEKIGW